MSHQPEDQQQQQQQQQQRQVRSSDGTVYTLRGIRNTDEVKIWAAFCAHVFRHKQPSPPPASYFERHYFNDPEGHNDPSLIRVAVVLLENGQEGMIVASCRVFVRRVSTSGTWTTQVMGGIGEVCTDESHRRRGLSKELLHDAIQQKMKGMSWSMLHAAPSFFPVYQSAGYVNILSRWSRVRIHLPDSTTPATTSTITKANNNWIIRHAEFPRDTKQLMTSHQRYSETKFVGCIIRSEDYWNQYLSRELEGSLWVLTTTTTENNNKNSNNIYNNSIVAWLSIRSRGPREWQLREFGCSEQQHDNSTTVAFQTLLDHAIRAQQPKSTATTTTTTTTTTGEETTFGHRLHIPTFLLERMEKQHGDADSDVMIDWESKEQLDDHGWMYRSLLLPEQQQQQQISLMDLCQMNEHFIWPSDSF